MNIRISGYLLLIITFISAGCANITAPTGGKKDVVPPRLLSVTPADSLLNTRVKKIELTFDEYINVTDAIKEVQISPILSIQPTVVGANKKVVVKIVDSLLEDNTTYRITFGNAIKDVHENNPFSGYSYMFSTGTYFDSMLLMGVVYNAISGKPDSSGVLVALYSGNENDSAVVKKKPKYVTRSDNKGKFAFAGLPERSFKIYAVKDGNGNIMYDGASQGEMIAFNNTVVRSGDSSAEQVTLKLFTEEMDSAARRADTLSKVSRMGGLKNKPDFGNKIPYTVNIDTSAPAKRTFDITKKLLITWNLPVQLNYEKIMLDRNSAGTDVDASPVFKEDTTPAHTLTVSTEWLENTEYTLRLAKGFAKDTAGNDLPPSKYVFRTFRDDDYGKITIHLPGKYRGGKYVLWVVAGEDSVYRKPITDTVVKLTRLAPAQYIFRIIEDKNGNGKWDAGNLFELRQPEDIIPYTEPLTLKAGWENIVDFEEKPVEKKPTMKDKAGKLPR